MKRLLQGLVFGLLTLLTSAVPSYAQQGVRSHRFTIAGPDSSVNLINTGIAYHQITWNVVGTASACAAQVDSSTNGTTWVSAGVITSQVCTANGMSTVTHVNANYIRINMTALTVTPGSSVTVTWDGYTTPPGGGGSGTVTSITATTPIVVTPNPITTVGDISCPTCNTSAATIAGAIAATQVAFGTGVNTIGGSADITWNDTTKELDLNHASAGVKRGILSVRGTGVTDCDGAGTPCLTYIYDDDSAVDWAVVLRNDQESAGEYTGIGTDAGGAYYIEGFSGTRHTQMIVDPPTGRIVLTGTDAAGVSLSSTTQVDRLSTNPNCVSFASPAACAKAAAGRVVVAAAATTVVVNTTAVDANSEIFLQFDSSLGAALSVTCNVTVALPTVTARTAGTSFTITVPVAPITNPACYSYFIVN